jgi:hypothetical protein
MPEVGNPGINKIFGLPRRFLALQELGTDKCCYGGFTVRQKI